MSWIAAGMAIAGAVTKAVGSIAEGNARANALNAEGAQHEVNAQIAEQNAVIAWQQGTAQESIVRRRAGQVLGQQAAGAAESNFGASGSQIDVARQSATNAELDSLNTVYNTDLKARAYKAQAENERYSGQVAHAGAGSARDQGMWGAVTGIVTSASNFVGSRSGERLMQPGVQPTTAPSFGGAPGGYTPGGWPEGGG